MVIIDRTNSQLVMITWERTEKEIERGREERRKKEGRGGKERVKVL